MNLSTLPRKYQVALYICSLLVVACGQPAWSSWLGLLAAVVGYALFWRVLICHETRLYRFYLATSWYTCVQLVQLSWFLSHPYLYIVSVYFVLSLLMGIQFGVIGIFIDRAHLQKVRSLAAIAGLWCIFEWSRLFLLSGLSWNPLGMALSGSLYSMQMASLWGVFGLSFWVIFVNLLALKAWLYKDKLTLSLWVLAALLPYIYGSIHLHTHESLIAQRDDKDFHTVLVQTAFPVEEELGIKDKKKMVAYVINEWRQILKITKKQKNIETHLIVLPEFVVPYGTYSFIYPYETVRNAFKDMFGEDSLKSLPPLVTPLAYQIKTADGKTQDLVNNAFWAQAMANYFQTGILAGFEDANQLPTGEMEIYSSALYFQPQKEQNPQFSVDRYEKRVLVPMGEYIPFEFCRTLAAAYGVLGSFNPGKEAKVFTANNIPFGVSICYEETFGNIVRENKNIGAIVLANLTNDAWYPNSRLTQQHFDHARLRTVECGLPLIRACNTGVTGAVDSLGRIVATLGDNAKESEWVADSLHVKVPTYTYATLYSRFGDFLIVGISMLLVVAFLRFKS